MRNLSLVFFGAGPVAASSLKSLNEHFEIEAVITKNRPVHHKGKAEVLDIAGELELPIITIENKSELDSKIASTKFKSQLGVLIDFGIIVSEYVINSFPKGIVNSHFSLLPQWRGADPITFSLLSGQKTTGVSLMLLSKGMDEGPVLSLETLDIKDDDTGVSLTEKLINLSNKMLKKNLPEYVDGKVAPIDQLGYAQQHGFFAEISYSRKLTKENGRIDWSKSAEVLEREIRAYQPWPKSYAKLNDILTITVYKAKLADNQSLAPGELKVVEDRLFIGTSTCALELLEVQPSGKNKMSTPEFLRGYLNKLFIQID